jgi:hypothetical protein
VRRKERAARFAKKKETVQAERQGVNDLGLDEAGVDEEEQPEGEAGDQPPGEPGSATGTSQAEAQRTKPFDPTSDNISYVCRQIKNHDLGFFFEETFPELPNAHVHKCLEIVWEVVCSIRDDETQHLQPPTDTLNHPKHGVNSHQPGVMMDWEEE